MEVHFAFATSGWPTDHRKDLVVLGHVAKGQPGEAHLYVRGWAANGYPADGTPRVANAIRSLCEHRVFGPPFHRQFLAPDSPPVTLFHLADPDKDSGPNHEAHLDQMISSLKAVLQANPKTQLVVCGYVLQPCPWTLPLLPCVSPVPIT